MDKRDPRMMTDRELGHRIHTYIQLSREARKRGESDALLEARLSELTLEKHRREEERNC